ncbi:MAG: hypothetical protein ACOCQC_01895 [Halanaerobiaceae bacterium]
MSDRYYFAAVVILLAAAAIAGFFSSGAGFARPDEEMLSQTEYNHSRYTTGEKEIVPPQISEEDYVDFPAGGEEVIRDFQGKAQEEFRNGVEDIKKNYRDKLAVKKEELNERLEAVKEQKRQEYEEKLMVKQEQYEKEMEEEIDVVRSERQKEMVGIDEGLSDDYYEEIINLQLKLNLLDLNEEDRSREMEKHRERIEELKERNRENFVERRKGMEDYIAASAEIIQMEYEDRLTAYGEELLSELNREIKREQESLSRELKEYSLSLDEQMEEEIVALKKQLGLDLEKLAVQEEIKKEF